MTNHNNLTEREQMGCGKLCYDKKVIRDLVECGQKYRYKKKVEIFLCDECKIKNKILKEISILIDRFEKKVCSLDWLHRVFINKKETNPDLLLSQMNLRDEIKRELKLKIKELI